MNLSWTLRDAAVGLAIVTVLAVTGCGSDAKQSPSSVPVAQDASSYCQQLAKLPDGLRTAVSNAILGGVSDDDKATIGRAVTQLNNAAADKSAPANAGTVLRRAAAVLDKVSKGRQLSDSEVRDYSKLEGTVNTCVHK